MPKANKEFILNYAMNRWQLNFKRNVGATSDSIRLCNPATLSEWEEYYYKNVRNKEHIDQLGEYLYKHIKDELATEERFHPKLIESITEEDCVNYMNKIVTERTFNGFMKERGSE